MSYLTLKLDNLVVGKKYIFSVVEGNGNIDTLGWDGVATTTSGHSVLLSGSGMNRVKIVNSFPYSYMLVGTTTGEVGVLDIDGNVIWTKVYSGDVIFDGVMDSQGNSYYVVQNIKTLYKVDIGGNVIGSFTLENYPRTLIRSIIGDYLYHAEYDHDVKKLDFDLNLIWEKNILPERLAMNNSWVEAQQTTEKIYLTESASKSFCVFDQDGVSIINKVLNTNGYPRGLVLKGNMAYIGTTTGEVCKIDLNTYSQVYNSQVFSSGNITSVETDGTYLYATNYDLSTVKKFEDTGSSYADVWSFTLPSPSAHSCILPDLGNWYVGMNNGTIVIIGLDGTLKDTSFFSGFTGAYSLLRIY